MVENAQIPNIPRLPNTSHSDIVIIGAGISGLALANLLVNSVESNFTCTVVGPTFKSIDDIEMKTRVSSPIIKGHVLRKLGIPLNSQRSVYERKVEVDGNVTSLGLFFAGFIKWNLNRRLAYDPVHFLDINLAQKDMYEMLSDNPRIHFIDSKFRGVEVDRNRITSVVIADGQKINNPQLIVDATGRKARVANELNKHIPNAVSETRTAKPSILISGFVEINNTLSEASSFLYEGSSVFFLKEGVLCAVSPIKQMEGSSSTHVLFFEGRTQTMESVLKKARSSPHSAEYHDTIVELFRLLSEDTKLEELVLNIKSVDRVINFRHEDDVKRKVHAVDSGLVLVGDSQSFTNPLIGSGFRNIITDINALYEALNSSTNLQDAARLYNIMSKKKERIKAAKSKLRYSIAKAASLIFGTGNLYN